MKKHTRGVCWIRRDLRLEDHAALSAATQNCESVDLVFVFDPEILSSFQNKKSHHVQFMFESLLALDSELKKRGTGLVILFGDPSQELPRFCKTQKVNRLDFNRDYEPKAITRDLEVTKALKDLGVEVHSHKDQVVFEEREVVKSDLTPYKVFTPYKNAWLKKYKTEKLKTFKVNMSAIQRYDTPQSSDSSKTVVGAKYQDGAKTLDAYTIKKLGFSEVKLEGVSVGSKGALEQLSKFQMSAYQKQRDFPAIRGGTSRLSPHLRFGTISIRRLIEAALEKRDLGHQTWLNELIWREFFQMILFHFPHVEHTSFRAEYAHIHWLGENAHLRAWQQGLTGYPIVDAAQRQLLQTGWMHNRLRMITASFLVKDLLINWQEGEDWFREHLIDHDLAANNGGWQWAASTGCDAQPYFRIFNPVLQSEKFDPDGEFIRQYVPELAKYPTKFIHAPWLLEKSKQKEFGCVIGKDYPAPIVDHASQKPKALKLYKRTNDSDSD